MINLLPGHESGLIIEHTSAYVQLPILAIQGIAIFMLPKYKYEYKY